MNTRFLAIGAIILAPTLSAQSDSRFMGLTAGTPLLQTQDISTCAASVCAPPGFPSTSAACAGGTAYDTRTRGTWISNGAAIAKVDSRNPFCDYQCPITLLPPSPIANGVVTGLAHHHRLNQLWATTSNNNLRRFEITNNGCGLVDTGLCHINLPLNLTLTGIAIDDVNGRVFYSASSWTGPSIAGGQVFVATQLDPCNPFCAVPVANCPNGTPLQQLRGIAYDACTDTLFVTDGQTTVRGQLSSTVLCQMALVGGCCPNPLPQTEPYVGLSIEPSTEATVGAPCTNGACPNCSPSHGLVGDPVLGNLDFGVAGRNLPANTIAATFFNIGPCDPNGLLVPPFCGPLHVNLTPTLLAFSQPTGGSIGCTGSTFLQISVQADPALCGLVISTQVMGICIPSPIGNAGTYSSPCLSWKISAS